METALITGASSGIGQELARCFAEDQCELVLVARSNDRLQQLADQLVAAHGTTATVIPTDLSAPDAPRQLVDDLTRRGIVVDVLVNNAGFGALGAFAELDVKRQVDMVQVNVVALTHLTALLLPGMLKRHTGGVLNVGSIAAYQAGPHMSVYYATKAYVLSFTEGLREEVADQGVTVTCLAPGPTETGFGEDSGMSKLAAFSKNAMSAGAVARSGYAGFRSDRAVVIPGLQNRLLAGSAKFSPRSWSRKLVKRMQRPR